MSKKKKVKEETSNVYVFFNVINHTMLYVDAFSYDEAMNKFDLSIHKHREDWRIFVECGLEPA